MIDRARILRAPGRHLAVVSHTVYILYRALEGRLVGGAGASRGARIILAQLLALG